MVQFYVATDQAIRVGAMREVVGMMGHNNVVLHFQHAFVEAANQLGTVSCCPSLHLALTLVLIIWTENELRLGYGPLDRLGWQK